MRLPIRPAPWCPALACAVLIAACGGSSHHRPRTLHKVPVRDQTVEVVSSLPLVGPDAWMGRTVRRGIALALAQADGRAGDFTVRYRSLDDARLDHGHWAAVQTAGNARGAAVDPATIAYIGDLSSGASRVSVPILNQAGIPQISPWSPYVGLTRAVGPTVTAAGDPDRYYPTSTRTFLRLAPDDAVQAAALLTAARDAGCTRMAVLRSGGSQDYSTELSGLLSLTRPRFPIRIVSSQAVPGGSVAGTPAVSPALALRRYVTALRLLDTGCLAYLGDPTSAGIATIAAVHASQPRTPIIGSDRVCQAAFGSVALRRELAIAGGPLLQCTLPAMPADTAGTEQFSNVWEIRYGVSPPAGPWAAYGYEAMRLILAKIAGLGPNGDERSRLLGALFSVRPRGSLLGSYEFSADGDSTVRAYGLWQVLPGAVPRLIRVMEPTPS